MMKRLLSALTAGLMFFSSVPFQTVQKTNVSAEPSDTAVLDLDFRTADKELLCYLTPDNVSRIGMFGPTGINFQNGRYRDPDDVQNYYEVEFRDTTVISGNTVFSQLTEISFAHDDRLIIFGDTTFNDGIRMNPYACHDARHINGGPDIISCGEMILKNGVFSSDQVCRPDIYCGSLTAEVNDLNANIYCYEEKKESTFGMLRNMNGDFITAGSLRTGMKNIQYLFNGDIFVQKNMTVDGDCIVLGDVTVLGDLAVNGSLRVGGTLRVTGEIKGTNVLFEEMTELTDDYTYDTELLKRLFYTEFTELNSVYSSFENGKFIKSFENYYNEYSEYIYMRYKFKDIKERMNSVPYDVIDVSSGSGELKGDVILHNSTWFANAGLSQMLSDVSVKWDLSGTVQDEIFIKMPDYCSLHNVSFVISGLTPGKKLNILLGEGYSEWVNTRIVTDETEYDLNSGRIDLFEKYLYPGYVRENSGIHLYGTYSSNVRMLSSIVEGTGHDIRFADIQGGIADKLTIYREPESEGIDAEGVFWLGNFDACSFGAYIMHASYVLVPPDIYRFADYSSEVSYTGAAGTKLMIRNEDISSFEYIDLEMKNYDPETGYFSWEPSSEQLYYDDDEKNYFMVISDDMDDYFRIKAFTGYNTVYSDEFKVNALKVTDPSVTQPVTSVTTLPPAVTIPPDEIVSSGSCGTKVTWTLNAEGLLTISGTGSMAGGHPSPFFKNTDIKKVVIEDGVKTIGAHTFQYCTEMTGITIPDSVTWIDEYAFCHCSSLTDIKIPDSVTRIENRVFDSCESLEEIVIPDSVESIGFAAFAECTSLKKAVLPKELEIIETQLFEKCVSLESIDIPDSVKEIKSHAFIDCTGMKSIFIPATVQSLGDFSAGYMLKYNESGGYYSTALIPDFIIQGYKYSPAYDYASENRITFEAEGIIVTTTAVTTTRPVPEKTTVMTTTPVPVTTVTTTTPAPVTTTVTTTTPAPVTTTVTTTTPAPVTTTVTTTTPVPVITTASSEENPGQKNNFIFGRNNWNFNNTPDYFEGTTYRDQISQKYADILSDSLNDMERAVVFDGYENTAGEFVSAAIDREWGGSCYGMSATALLYYNGLLRPGRFSLGARSLYEAENPLKNDEVRSLITYYQMLQYKDSVRQKSYVTGLQTNKKNIKDILAAIDRYGSVLVSYTKINWGSHAVVAYGYEYKGWIADGKSYGGCIFVCDPYNSRTSNRDYNIYFDPETYDWTIPAYKNEKVSSDYRAKFSYFEGDINIINNGGYISSDDADYDTDEDHTVRLDMYDLSQDAEISKTVKKSDGGYMVQGGGIGDIVRDTVYSASGNSSGIDGFNLRDEKSGYSITQYTAHNLESVIRYRNCMLTACSKLAEEIIFDYNGFVSVEGERSDYSIGMTYNDNHPTDWYTVAVNGADAEKAELEMTEDGYILRADRLDSVTVTAKNRDITADVSFTTEYSEVFIYEIDEYTIGIKADTDGDGAFDTLIAQSSEGIKGDVNADGKVSAADISGIKKCIIGSASVSVKKRADINESGDVDIFDLIRMKRNVAS